MKTNFVRDFEARREFARWFGALPSWEWVACDVETTGLDPWNDTLRLVQFGTADEAWALPYPEQLEAIEYAFQRERQLVGWNGKFDEQFLINSDLATPPRFEDDAKIMAHLLFSEQDIGLKAFSDNHLGGDSSSAQREMRWVFRETKTTFRTIPTNTYEYWHYGCVDTILTAKAAAYLYPMLIERGYEELYELEMKVVRAIANAERKGMAVDLEYCQEQFDKLTHDAKAIQDRYPEVPLAGRKKIIELLEAEGVKLPRTAKGNPKLDEEVLAEVKHPIADDILEYRGLLKNANTYFKAYLDHAVEGRVHTTMQTMRARTGRMSSSEPNLQNVPKREAGAYVRRAFMASPGCTLVSADYSQIEYRIFAAACGEPRMIQAFLDGKDMHAVTAEIALGHEPTKSERDMAKNGNFSELYLAGLEKFAHTAGISLDAARRFKKVYHEAFPRVKPFTGSVIRMAQANLFMVQTRFGRRIGVDPEKPYAAPNYMIQGTAADVLKRAIARIDETEWGQYLVLTVHDELIFDVPDPLVERFIEELPGLMEDRETFSVPLTIEVSTGKRWGE